MLIKLEINSYSLLHFLECFEPNTNYPSNDLIQKPQLSILECLAFCRQTDGCNVFTWRKSDGYCWLKSKRGKSIVDSSLISGPTCGMFYIK